MIKRVFDFICALILTVLFFPLMVILGIFVWIRIGPPIVFAQSRPGLNGKIFTMYKLHTMQDLKDADGHFLSDGERIPRFGRVLRSTSLDELPELFNVLKGDMSLVGPRPLLVEYLDRYTPEQMRRHEVKPGITGWAQINGRNALSWEDKFRLDVWYVDNQSFMLDMKILLRTLVKVIKREDISMPGYAITKVFMGSSNDCPDNECRT